MSKESTKAALDRFYTKDAKQTDRAMNGVKRKSNARPEFELTVKPCWKWFAANGFSMSIIESRAVYNADAGRYIDGQTESGFPDSVGCCPDGTAAFVEFKAPGSLSNISLGQYEFLMEKIKLGCFAVCVASVSSLDRTWCDFIDARNISRETAITFLTNQLQVPRAVRQQAPPEPGMRF